MNWTDAPRKIRILGKFIESQERAPMHHKYGYDLFEKFPDGSSLWRACVIGLESTRRLMGDLARRSPNQFYAMHLASGKIVPHDLHQGVFEAAPKVARRSRAAVA
jgi:hypothetical protein